MVYYKIHSRQNTAIYIIPQLDLKISMQDDISNLSLAFIQAISIAPLQVLYYSEALPTQHGYCAGISCQNATGNRE